MAFEPLTRKLVINGIRQYCNCINLNDAYIISAVRTPIGCFQGKLSSLSAVQLGEKALAAAVEKAQIKEEEISEFIMGCSFQAGLGSGPAHQVALFAGLPFSIISSTINKLCASGMKAVILGAQCIQSQAQEVVAVGGAESLSNVPYILRRKNMRIGNICLPDLIFHDSISDIFEQVDITHWAEQTVKEFKFTRKDQDDYATESYSRAANARDNGVFQNEIIPIVLKSKKGEEEVVCEDEEIRRYNPETFTKLTPDIGKEGTITVGNASGFHDAASMMILSSGNYVLKKNLCPLARIVSFGEGSLDPKKFCVAPAIAISRALVRANLTAEKISLWEISETFSVTAMANAKILKLDYSKLNINGGAVSLGHPFAMTGTRIVAHLAHILEPGEYGCASVSHSTGGASAVIIQKMP